MSANVGTFCGNCGKKLKTNTTKPCPRCGSTIKSAKVEAFAKMSANAIVTTTNVKEWIEQNEMLVLVTASLTVFGAIIGIYVAGAPGISLGLVMGVAAFLLGFITRTHHKETTTRGP